jgi:hypothetical protein
MGAGCLGAGSSGGHLCLDSASGGSAHHQSLTHRLLLAAGFGRPALRTAAGNGKPARLGIGGWRAARLLREAPNAPERYGDRDHQHSDCDKDGVAEDLGSRAEHAGGQQRRARAADQCQQPATDDGKHLTGTGGVLGARAGHGSERNVAAGRGLRSQGLAGGAMRSQTASAQLLSAASACANTTRSATRGSATR